MGRPPMNAPDPPLALSREQERLQAVENLLRDAAERGGLEGSAVDLQQMATLLKNLPAARIAALLAASPPKTRRFLWELVPLNQEARVMHYMEAGIRDDLLRDMNTAELSVIVDGMEADDVADLLQTVPARITHEVLEMMSAQNRDRVQRVLDYADDSAGGLMNTDAVAVRSSLSADAVLRYLRRYEELPPLVGELYVVDRKDRFVGVLPLSRLLCSPLQTTVREMMITGQVEIIPALAPAGEVAERFERYGLLEAPVVDEQGVLLGRITADDVVEIIREKAARPLLGRVGLLGGEEDTFITTLRAAPRRMVWLGINLGTAFIAAATISLFEEALDKVVALAILMPIVASMGGIAGSQTLTVVERGIARGHLGGHNAHWLLSREMQLAALNALLWSGFVALAASLWFRDPMIGALIAAALVINLTAAALAGVLLPLVLRWLGIDPAVAGNVVLTTITDVVGFMSFLGLATLVYG